MEKYLEKIKSKLVFIVEDNEIYSMMFDYMLTKYSNCNVKRYTSAEECLQNVYMNPDIIVLDYYLPKMNGLETLKQIKKYNSKIVVIALTAQNDINVVKKLLDAGVNKYFQKVKDPVEKICKTIDTVLFEIQSKEQYTKRVNMIKSIAIAVLLCIITILALYFFLLRNL